MRPLEHAWSGSAPAVLVGSGALAAAVAVGLVPIHGLTLAVVVALVPIALLVTALSSFEPLGRRGRLLAISPLVPAAATWLALFVLRPLELYVTTDHAADGLARLGFGPADLTRTAALGALGVAAWSLGYLLALGKRHRTETARDQRPLPFSSLVAAVLLCAGTVAWLVLFQRQGGLDTLLQSAVAIRSDQRFSFWAFVGVWVVQAVGLYALLVALDGGGRGARLVVVAATLSALLAAVATQLRMFVVFSFVSAIVLVIALRTIRRVHVLAGVALAIVGTLALGFAQQVRAYTHLVRTPEAVELAVRTPLWASYVSDLGTFDHFVAMRQLVPSSIDYLDGRSLAEVPQALVPRSVWADKPIGLDHEVSSYLYPGAEAGVPISAQGELYWNGGVPAVAIGCLVLGLLFGALARACLTAARGRLGLLAYAIALPFTHAFLTRGFATMFQNLVFALLALAIVVLVLDGRARDRIAAAALGRPQPA